MKTQRGTATPRRLRLLPSPAVVTLAVVAALYGCSSTPVDSRESDSRSSRAASVELVEATHTVMSRLSDFSAQPSVDCALNVESPDADIRIASGSPTSTCGVSLFREEQILRLATELLLDWLSTEAFDDQSLRSQTADDLVTIDGVRRQLNAAVESCDATALDEPRCSVGLEAHAAYITVALSATHALRRALDADSTNSMGRDDEDQPASSPESEHMTYQSAAQFYLDVICPTNETLDQLNRSVATDPSRGDPSSLIPRAVLEAASAVIEASDESARQLSAPPARWPAEIEADLGIVIADLRSMSAYFSTYSTASTWDNIPNPPAALYDVSASQRVRAFLGLPLEGQCSP